MQIRHALAVLLALALGLAVGRVSAPRTEAAHVTERSRTNASGLHLPPGLPEEAPIVRTEEHEPAQCHEKVAALEARVRDLDQQLAAAYLTGGAADPYEFPDDLDEAYTPEAVEDWVEKVRSECVGDADVRLRVDCGEFPCLVAATYPASMSRTEVFCLPHDQASNAFTEALWPLEDVSVRAGMFFYGDPGWPGEGEGDRFDARRSFRERAMFEVQMADLTADAPQ